MSEQGSSLLRKRLSENALLSGELDFRLAESWGIMRAVFEPTEKLAHQGWALWRITCYAYL